MDQLLDDPADEELQPSERVFGNAEMLDMVVSFLDQKSLVKARAVCKQWREVSELSLKRRLLVSRVEPSRLSSFPFIAYPRIFGLQKVNYRKTVSVHLRNNETRKYKPQDVSELPSEDVHLAFFENVELVGRSSRYESLITATALVVTATMEMDWLPLVTQLTLYDTLTAAEWTTVGLIIVGKFKSLETLSMTIPWNDNRKVVSQCYAKLLKQEYENLKDLSFSCLKNLSAEVTQSMHNWKFPGLDVVRRSPGIQNFNIEYKANAAHEQLEVRYSAEESTYQLNCRISEEYAAQFTSIVTSFTTVAVTSLGSQQLASVETVNLDKCISKDDWRTGAAFKILEKFPHLRHLSVKSTCIYRLESKNAIQDLDTVHFDTLATLSQLESLEVSYASMGPKFRVSKADRATRFPHGVSLAFLEKCQNLTSFAFSASASFNQSKPFRSYLKATRPKAYCGTKHGWTYNRMESSFDTTREESSGLAAAMDSLTMDVIKLFLPTSVTTTSPLDIVAHLLSMDNAAALETLNLSFWMLSLPVPVNVQANDRVFGNVKKLSWTAKSDRIKTKEVDNIDRIPNGFVFENVTSFIFWPNLGRRCFGLSDGGWEPLMKRTQRNLNKMTPNVRLFVTSFLHPDRKADSYTLTAALQVAKSFGKLQHLVLAAKVYDDDSKSLSKTELLCLKGLSSLTIIIRSTEMKIRYTQLFVKACVFVPSIRKLNIYYPQDEEYQDDSDDYDDGNESDGKELKESSDKEHGSVDRENVSTEQDAGNEETTPTEQNRKRENNMNFEIDYTGITKINDNLTVTCGQISELQGKAVFDGIKDSGVTWEEIIEFSL